MSETTPGTDVPVDVTMAELDELVRLFNESDWDGLELDLRGVHLALGRQTAPGPAAAPAPAPAAAPVVPATPAPATPAPAAPMPAAPAPSTPAPAPPAPAPVAGTGTRTEISAPVVGTFWVSPSPGEPPFVQIGDAVEAGQQLAIVEVMKLMSDVSSSVAGRVVEVCAVNADLVEFGQVLFVIESDDG
ncbi:acetyl-CoA carboxylase biotin carboxyl carrier protein [Nocardioides sp. NPDC101246]|uniref:acetyl-CoA carboxylase biotin carboxyl carrier protein n=1 Tax=Nocardioides sp. NPDC101246 TaxID=3364336 RepID=UPI003803289E